MLKYEFNISYSTQNKAHNQLNIITINTGIINDKDLINWENYAKFMSELFKYQR
jgi:short-subunit dehydrogenase involved in D-alanine esterification of teichoic acids